MIATENQAPTLGRLARRTVSTCLGALENRAELFAVEFEEENDRIIKLVMFGVGTLFLSMLTILLTTGSVIFLIAPEYRVYAAFGFAAFYLIGAVVGGLTVKKLLKQSPFAESLKQIKKDAQLLDAFK